MTILASELSTLVQVRISPPRLVQLTNYDTTATSINTTVLEAACDDAIGQFMLASGYDPNKLIQLHVAILVKGVQYFLELYRGRDSGIISNLERVFFRDCNSIREKSYGMPGSNSNLNPSRDVQNALPDADRNRAVWNQSNTARKPEEIKL